MILDNYNSDNNLIIKVCQQREIILKRKLENTSQKSKKAGKQVLRKCDLKKFIHKTRNVN